MKLILTLFLVIGFSQPAYAQSWFERIFGPSEKTVERERVNKKHANHFSDNDKQLIADYFKEKKQKSPKKNKGKKKKLPPGLAKKETLPPGLAKQLEKNGTLPPGLAKRDLP
jgi:hypothetical protein